MSSPNDPADAVNIEELKEIMDDDMELIRECFTEFVKDWPLLYVQIKGAAMEKDGQVLDETAHKLKGTLKYLAAEDAANAALMMESAGRDNDFQEIDTKLDTLKNECQKVIEYIRGFTP